MEIIILLSLGTAVLLVVALFIGHSFIKKLITRNIKKDVDQKVNDFEYYSKFNDANK